MKKFRYDFHNGGTFHLHIFSEIKTKVCWNDVDAEHEDFPNKKAQEEDENQVASHPILLYKLIKQMNWFYKKNFTISFKAPLQIKVLASITLNL